MIQVEGARSIDLRALQQREVFLNRFRRLPLVERLHYRVQGDTCTGNIVAPIPFLNVIGSHRIVPCSQYRALPFPLQSQPYAFAATAARSLSASALSVASQLKVSSVRPKCPKAAVLR